MPDGTHGQHERGDATVRDRQIAAVRALLCPSEPDSIAHDHAAELVDAVHAAGRDDQAEARGFAGGDEADQSVGK